MGEIERFELTIPIGAFWGTNPLGRTNFPTLSERHKKFSGRHWCPNCIFPANWCGWGGAKGGGVGGWGPAHKHPPMRDTTYSSSSAAM